MKKLAICLALLCSVSFSAETLLAGELSADLAASLSNRTPDEKITVWIKLPPIDNRSELKRMANQSAMSAGERHATMIERLKADHAAAQRDLLRELRDMELQGRAGNIRTFWISNTVVATISAGELERLAARFDIETVYLPPDIRAITPPDSRNADAAAQEANAASTVMRYIRADSAWAAGYTGAGRLICTFDTGIDGDHPAYASRWKGLDGDWRAAWFDPVDQDTFPDLVTGSTRPSHGTQVLGAAVGCNPASGDTTGVAPEAKWISAAVIDLPSQISHAILEAFEWAADPDGNPNTVSDRPDVINHSWGFVRIGHNISCEEIFFDAIDNTEALGIVNIFAAGNSGPATQTIANPANRALDSIDCFAVGGTRLYGVSYPPDSVGVYTLSSRGPSDCNFGRHKPNVVTPGYAVRTTTPGGGYTIPNGTSFSAPQVAGLVALLRQKNPNATVDQIKTAILTSTSRTNFPSAANDSTGWGEINCMTALSALSATNSQPHIRVYNFTHAPIAPGDTLEGTLTIQNTGATAPNVTGVISSANPFVTVLDGLVTFGTLNEGDTVSAPQTVRIAVSDQSPISSIYPLEFALSIDAQAPIPMTVSVLVAPNRYRSVATHDNGTVRFTISNFGTYGMGPISIMPLQGAGFTYKGGNNYLWEGGVILSTSLLQASSGLHSYVYASDNDFSPADDGVLRLYEPGPLADQQSYSAFIDANSSNPIGVRIIQESFSFAAPYDDFVILRYILVNEQDTTISNLRLGLFLDWDIFSYTLNAGGYNSVDEFQWMAYNSNVGEPLLSHFRGAKLLEGTLSSAQTVLDSVAAPPAFGGDGFSEREKALLLLPDTASYTRYAAARENLIQAMGAGPMTLTPGQRDTVAFAVLAGDNLGEITTAAEGSAVKYAEIKAATAIAEPGEPVIPRAFGLHQNYPNPFNPGTTISFDLPVAGEYTLRIFNTLGQTVDEIRGWSTAGTVSIVWNADGLSSGVYFYQVTSGDISAARKMLLLK